MLPLLAQEVRTAVAAGSTHGLLLKSDGTVWGWGGNGAGQLGREGDDALEPIQIAGLEHIRFVAAGDRFSLALTADGVVLAWGQNEHGEMGNGSKKDVATPTPVKGLPRIVEIAAAEHHAMALDADGHVWDWGDDPNRSPILVPEMLPQVSNIVAIAAGDKHDIALDRTGAVWVWGDHGLIDMGIGRVPGLSDVVAVAGGYHVTLALRKDGTVWAAGYGTAGQLGNGTTTNLANTAVMASGLTRVKAIAARYMTMMALKSDGSVWVWGSNHFRQVGNPTYTEEESTRPVRTANLRNAVAIAAGGDHSVAVTADGSVWNWGQNENGALGADADLLSRSDVPMKPGTPIPPECRPLFACGTAGGKVIRICGTEDPSNIDKFTAIHYRFGPELGPPELMYPADPENAPPSLFFSKDTVWFQNGAYRYALDLNGGVTVTDQSGKRVTNISCNERPQVYVEYLRENLPKR